jgi:hypothetical protein
MASPVVVYFAGIGTVVAALGVGFGSAIMLTSTTPVQKVPPAAFAKREQPLEPQVPAPAAVVAPAQATESSDDVLAGLAPPLTASPVPKAEAVTRALALNPPAADAAPAPAAAEIVRPVQTARPVAAPEETAAVKSKEPRQEKDIIAPEKKSDRKVVERKQAIVEKQKAADEANDDEPNAEAPRVSAEPDRPTREGF